MGKTKMKIMRKQMREALRIVLTEQELNRVIRRAVRRELLMSKDPARYKMAAETDGLGPLELPESDLG